METYNFIFLFVEKVADIFPTNGFKVIVLAGASEFNLQVVDEYFIGPTQNRFANKFVSALKIKLFYTSLMLYRCTLICNCNTTQYYYYIIV